MKPQNGKPQKSWNSNSLVGVPVLAILVSSVALLMPKIGKKKKFVNKIEWQKHDVAR